MQVIQESRSTTADGARDALDVATAAARSGDRAEARRLLFEISERDPENEVAWVWLASVADEPAEAIRALRAAHELAPMRERTIASLKRLLFREGVAAAQAAETTRARLLLEECAELDPDDARVWLWLASIAVSRGDAISCLRRTLRIEPTHRLARATLRQILLHEGAAAAQAGDGDRARAYLTEAATLYLDGQQARRANPTLSSGPPALEDAARLEAEALAEAEAEASADVAADTTPAGQDPEAAVIAECRPVTGIRARASVRTAILPGFDPLTHDVFALGESSATDDSRLVMVVDHNAAVQKSVAATLERYGHRVLAARDEHDALEKLARVEPDLILVDVGTTHADGYKVCRTLRTTIGRRGVPVVISGAQGVADRIRGWMAGASDSIAKPFAERALINLVNRYAAAPN
jgi:CheY-like chemotaxis protein